MLPGRYKFITLCCFALQLAYPAQSQLRHHDTLVLHFDFNKDILRQKDAARLDSDAADAGGARAPDTVITLSNINFIEDTPIPTESSRMSIPAYVRMLKQYSRSYIEIDGYCNSPRRDPHLSKKACSVRLHRATVGPGPDVSIFDQASP
jgi:hypothetical protein